MTRGTGGRLGHRRECASDDDANGDRRRRIKGGNDPVWRSVPDCAGHSVCVHSPKTGGATSGVDDPRILAGSRGRNDSAHRRCVLRNPKRDTPDASGVLRRCVLAWLHDSPDRGRGVDQLHANRNVVGQGWLMVNRWAALNATPVAVRRSAARQPGGTPRTGSADGAPVHAGMVGRGLG